MIFQGTWSEWMCAYIKGNGRSDLEASQKLQSKLAIPAPMRLKQDCQKKFEAIVNYLVSSGPGWVMYSNTLSQLTN